MGNLIFLLLVVAGLENSCALALPGPAELAGSVGSGSKTMGAVELANGKVGFHEMDDHDNFTDSELVYHVRDALNSVSLVSSLPHASDPLANLFISCATLDA